MGNVCGSFVCSKMVKLEHHIIILHKLCILNQGRKKLASLLTSLCAILYFIAYRHFGQCIKSNYFVFDDSFFKKEQSLWNGVRQIWKSLDYGICFKEYDEMIHSLKIKSENIIELKSENKIHIHP